MSVRSIIRIVLLFVGLAFMHYFIRHDYPTIAFCFMALLIVYMEFFFPKWGNGK